MPLRVLAYVSKQCSRLAASICPTTPGCVRKTSDLKRCDKDQKTHRAQSENSKAPIGKLAGRGALGLGTRPTGQMTTCVFRWVARLQSTLRSLLHSRIGTFLLQRFLTGTFSFSDWSLRAQPIDYVTTAANVCCKAHRTRKTGVQQKNSIAVL